ncbi:MAG: hypothetical protein HQ596_03385 [Candidatus Saganbacteria bacterium]|nr:hypothetical protein [Candidatus Saganbacteria bacterium]
MNIDILEFAARQIEILNNAFYVERDFTIFDAIFKTFEENYPHFKPNSSYVLPVVIEKLPEKLKKKYLFKLCANYKFLKEKQQNRKISLDNALAVIKGYIIRLNLALIITKYDANGRIMAGYDEKKNIETNILRIDIRLSQKYTGTKTKKEISGYKHPDNCLIFKNRSIKYGIRPYCARIIVLGKKNSYDDILAQIIYYVLYSLENRFIQSRDSKIYSFFCSYTGNLINKLKYRKYESFAKIIDGEKDVIISKTRNSLLKNYVKPLYSGSFKGYLSKVIDGHIKDTIRIASNNKNVMEDEETLFFGEAGHDTHRRLINGNEYLFPSERKHAEMGVKKDAFYKMIQRGKIKAKRTTDGKLVYDNDLMANVKNAVEEKNIKTRIILSYMKNRNVNKNSAIKWLSRMRKKGLSLRQIAEITQTSCNC